MAEIGNLAEQPRVEENGEFGSSGAVAEPAAGPVSSDGGTTDWICPKCGNSNYSHRSVCNMRMCRHPRNKRTVYEDGSEADAGGEGEGRSKRGKMGENWNCKKCGNENFASRTHCNMRKCREPRDEWLCPSCGNLNFKYRTSCNMRKCGAPKPGGMGGMQGGMGMGMGGMQGGMGAMQGQRGFSAQYGTDATANAMAAYSAAYGMGAGGEGGLDAYGYNQFMMGQNPYMGFPQGGQQQGGAGAGGGSDRGNSKPRVPQERKEGDWACEKCGNFNYASRTKCNMRNCQEVRKDM